MDAEWWAKVRKARDGQMSDEPKPLTDEDLIADLERVRERAVGDSIQVQGEFAVGDEEHAEMGREREDTSAVIAAAQAEISRLRSDEWLRAAAEEINTAGRLASELTTDEDFKVGYFEILRKHRDGKA